MVDGSHIKILLLTFFFRFLRPLVENGHIYIAMSPLYRVVHKKEVFYLLDDRELSAFKEKYKDCELEVGYVKGLGELDPQQLKETTLDKSKRRIKKVLLEDEKKTEVMFDLLMGSSADKRKAFIEANAHKANIDI